jgi:hypothetical protein
LFGFLIAGQRYLVAKSSLPPGTLPQSSLPMSARFGASASTSTNHAAAKAGPRRQPDTGKGVLKLIDVFLQPNCYICVFTIFHILHIIV